MPTSAPAAIQKERVVVAIDASGGIDVEGMRPKTVERLVEAIRKSQSGLFPSAPAAAVKRWPDFAVRGLYGLLGAAETAAAARKYPMEIASAVFMYSDQEMEILMEPTQGVLAKYAGNLDRWQEEIALGLVLIQVHFAKLHTLKRIMVDYTARSKAAAEANKPAPGPAPGDVPVSEGPLN